MTAPKVSVLVPNYNYAPFLPEAIESLLRQDFGDFELLVSDNASTDNSAAVIRQFAERDRRLQLIAKPVNLGMVAHFNWCLSHAGGEYVKFLLSDDKLASAQTLSTLVAMLDANASATLVASARLVIGDDSTPLGTQDDFACPGRHAGADAILRCLMENCNLIGEPSAALFRRRHALRGFNASYRQLVDEEMWFHLLEKGDFIYTSAPLCCFRKHARQQSESNNASQIGQLEAARLFQEYCGRSFLYRKIPARLVFEKAYELRKWRKRNPQLGDELRAIEQGLIAQLTTSSFALRWLQRKLSRPFSHLGRWITSSITSGPALRQSRGTNPEAPRPP